MSEITVTIRQLLEAESSLVSLGQEKINGKAAYSVAKLLRLVRNELNDFREARKKIFQTHGVRREARIDEQQQGMTDAWDAPVGDLDKLRALTEELELLVDTEVTLPWGPISISALNTTCPECKKEKPVDFEPSVLANLGDLLTD